MITRKRIIPFYSESTLESKNAAKQRQINRRVKPTLLSQTEGNAMIFETGQNAERIAQYVENGDKTAEKLEVTQEPEKQAVAAKHKTAPATSGNGEDEMPQFPLYLSNSVLSQSKLLSRTPMVFSLLNDSLSLSCITLDATYAHQEYIKPAQIVFETLDEYWVYRYTQRYSLVSMEDILPTEDTIIALQMDLVDSYLDALYCSIAKSLSKPPSPLPPAHVSLSGLSNYIEIFRDSSSPIPRNRVKTKIKSMPPSLSTCAPPLQKLEVPDLKDHNVQYHVLIVGAGVSGLLAANILKCLGFSVCVIEARNYAGGRISTIDMSETKNGEASNCNDSALAGIPADLGANWLMYDVSYPQYPWHWAYQNQIETANILGSVWEPICTALWFDENGKPIDSGRIQLLYDITLVANDKLNSWVNERLSKENCQDKKQLHNIGKLDDIGKVNSKGAAENEGNLEGEEDIVNQKSEEEKNGVDKEEFDGTENADGLIKSDSVKEGINGGKLDNEEISVAPFDGQFDCYEDGIVAAIKWVIENRKAFKIPTLGKPFDDTDLKVMMKMIQRLYGCVNKLSDISLSSADSTITDIKWHTSGKYFERLGYRRQLAIKAFYKHNKPGPTPHIFDFKNISGDRLCHKGYNWYPKEIIRRGNLTDCIHYGQRAVGITLMTSDRSSLELDNTYTVAEEDVPGGADKSSTLHNGPFSGAKLVFAPTVWDTDAEIKVEGTQENFFVHGKEIFDNSKNQVQNGIAGEDAKSASSFVRSRKAAFEPSEAFKGEKQNYIYKKGRNGVGYYLDRRRRAVSSMPPVDASVNSGSFVNMNVHEHTHCSVEVQDSSSEAGGHTHILTALRVIVTVPIGVLQAKSLSFSPNLSDELWDAINSWGRGCHNKILLRFSRIFWEPNAGFFNIADPMFQFMNLHAFGVENCICAHSFGYYNWDHLSDEQVVECCTSLLYNMFPLGKDAEKPVVLHKVVTRWDTDISSLCSYGYFSKNATDKSHKLLARPFPWYSDYAMDESSESSLSHCMVFFAGEHTSDWGQQCVHGAAHSGVRVAAECASSLTHATIPPWLDDKFDDNYNDSPDAKYNVGESSAQYQWKSVWWTNHPKATINTENYRATHPRDVYCRAALRKSAPL